MPELPDVEVQRRFLEAHAANREIAAVSVDDTRILGNCTPGELGAAVRGARFTGTHRVGKYLFARTNGTSVAFHFGMTGYLYFRHDNSFAFAGGMESQGSADKTKVAIEFADGSALGYVNVRLLGRIYTIRDTESFLEEHEIGPDALEVDRERMEKLLSGAGSVKSTLMNQKKISGIGNVYSDEILYQARLHPRRPLKSLNEEERNRLFEALREVLQTAIESDAEPDRLPDHYLTRHRPTGTGSRRRGGEDKARLPNGAVIEPLKVGGRTCYVVPSVQREG